MDEPVEIWTDGACSGNPGPGGWGAVLSWAGHERELSGGEAQTTNNRMELRAAIEALAALKQPASVRLHTDSMYVRDGITAWIHRWRKNGWRTSDNRPVKNADLWAKLDEQMGRHRVEWLWVRGHSGNGGNERADRLARKAIATLAAKPTGSSAG